MEKTMKMSFQHPDIYVRGGCQYERRRPYWAAARQRGYMLSGVTAVTSGEEVTVLCLCKGEKKNRKHKI